jgi:hypothetical protein
MFAELQYKGDLNSSYKKMMNCVLKNWSFFKQIFCFKVLLVVETRAYLMFNQELFFVSSDVRTFIVNLTSKINYKIWKIIHLIVKPNAHLLGHLLHQQNLEVQVQEPEIMTGGPIS